MGEVKMGKRPSARLLSTWTELQSVACSVPDGQTETILQGIKEWFLRHRRMFPSNVLQSRPALGMLIAGEDSHFPPVDKGMAVRQLRHILSQPVPRNAEMLADRLESAVVVFAIYSKGQDCPVCQEGFLGYWIDPKADELYLLCPECIWMQDGSGMPPLAIVPVRPAKFQELQKHGILV